LIHRSIAKSSRSDDLISNQTELTFEQSEIKTDLDKHWGKPGKMRRQMREEIKRRIEEAGNGALLR
jgi:hypothetical protein